MSKENISSLDIAKKSFENQKIISILGSLKTGKTIVGALLLDTIINKFLEDHPEYDFRIKNGIEHMKANSMSLKGGKFPEKTAESEIKQVQMILKQKKASGGEIELRLNDFAGELNDYFFTNEMDASSLATRIINYEKQKGTKFSPYSFLIFSKVYVLLIDCQKIELWKDQSFDNMILLNKILALKQSINESKDGKINNPIAIMFTKTDLLDEKNRILTAEDLLKKHMPEFYRHMKGMVTKDVGFFKVYLDVERGSDNKPIKIKIESGTPYPSLYNAKASTRSGKPTLITPPAGTSEVKKQEFTYKVKIPLSYSEDEYVKFISWLDENLND